MLMKVIKPADLQYYFEINGFNVKTYYFNFPGLLVADASSLLLPLNGAQEENSESEF